MKKLLSIGSTVTMAVSLTACGREKKAASGSADGETIRIGAVCPLTGESSLFGDVLSQTVQLLVKQKNEAGDLLGRRIEIMVYDNYDDAMEATSATRKAIPNDKVVAFIGMDSSATTLAFREVVAENETPFIISIATNSEVTTIDDGEACPQALRACLSDPRSGAILGQYAVDECGFKKITIIYETGSNFSTGVTNKFTQTVKNIGGEIVTKGVYNTEDMDYRAVLTKTRNSGDFDVLYTAAGYYKQIGLIASQAREPGIGQPFLTTEGAMSSDLSNTASDSVEGMIYNVAVDAASDNVHGLPEDFQAEWGYDPSLNVGLDCHLAYDAFQLLTGAIEKVGEVDPARIRDSLENTTELQGSTSSITFSPKTHLVHREVPIYQIRDGGSTKLSPFSPAIQ